MLKNGQAIKWTDPKSGKVVIKVAMPAPKGKAKAKSPFAGMMLSSEQGGHANNADGNVEDAPDDTDLFGGMQTEHAGMNKN